MRAIILDTRRNQPLGLRGDDRTAASNEKEIAENSAISTATVWHSYFFALKRETYFKFRCRLSSRCSPKCLTFAQKSMVSQKKFFPDRFFLLGWLCLYWNALRVKVFIENHPPILKIITISDSASSFSEKRIHLMHCYFELRALLVNYTTKVLFALSFVSNVFGRSVIICLYMVAE